jgi:hypothetical protein
LNDRLPPGPRVEGEVMSAAQLWALLVALPVAPLGAAESATTSRQAEKYAVEVCEKDTTALYHTGAWVLFGATFVGSLLGAAAGLMAYRLSSSRSPEHDRRWAGGRNPTSGGSCCD